MNNKFPAGYFEYLDVICTNTTSLSAAVAIAEAIAEDLSTCLITNFCISTDSKD
jgi:hypothetical protein